MCVCVCVLWIRVYPPPTHAPTIPHSLHAGKSNPELNLRHDWHSLLSTSAPAVLPTATFLFRNFSRDYYPSADTLVDYLRAFAEHFQLNVEVRLVRLALRARNCNLIYSHSF